MVRAEGRNTVSFTVLCATTFDFLASSSISTSIRRHHAPAYLLRQFCAPWGLDHSGTIFILEPTSHPHAGLSF